MSSNVLLSRLMSLLSAVSSQLSQIFYCYMRLMQYEWICASGVGLTDFFRSVYCALLWMEHGSVYKK
jgi:hypothetical protein